MNRRQLLFSVLINAVVSLVIALAVVWAFESRRPDPEELASINAPRVEPVLASSGEPQISTPGNASNSEAAPNNNVGNNGQTGNETGGETPLEPETDAGEPPPQDEEYVVQAGDSLSLIATRFNITIDDIVRANNLANPDSIFSGQRLTIPLQGRQGAEQIAESSAPLGEGVEIAQVEGSGELGSENVLIVNESNLAFSLLGWRLEREGGPAYTFGNIPLFPGSSVRLHTRGGEDSSIDLFWDESAPQWTGNTVARLINAQGIEIYRYTVP